jgi:hypothetical protein
MALFNIGDHVSVCGTDVCGSVTDKMYSEARAIYMYVIKPDDGGRSIMREEDELEPFHCSEVEYQIEPVISESVVVVNFYEVTDDSKTLVARGHAHILHDGALGIVQATSYATRRALLRINNNSTYIEKEN